MVTAPGDSTVTEEAQNGLLSPVTHWGMLKTPASNLRQLRYKKDREEVDVISKRILKKCLNEINGGFMYSLRLVKATESDGNKSQE